MSILKELYPDQYSEFESWSTDKLKSSVFRFASKDKLAENYNDMIREILLVRHDDTKDE